MVFVVPLLSFAQVFIRELISNGSDALEKLRHRLITGGGETAPMEIHLQTDAAKGTHTHTHTHIHTHTPTPTHTSTHTAHTICTCSHTHNAFVWCLSLSHTH